MRRSHHQNSNWKGTTEDTEAMGGEAMPMFPMSYAGGKGADEEEPVFTCLPHCKTCAHTMQSPAGNILKPYDYGYKAEKKFYKP